MNRIMQFFRFEHLPPRLRGPSEAIAELAHIFESTIPDGPEKTAGLRKLLEAKDCFVRALMDKGDTLVDERLLPPTPGP